MRSRSAPWSCAADTGGAAGPRGRHDLAARVIEINGVEVSKGAALAQLADLRGVVQAEVAAIGDSTLDLSMIEWAGYGVAVANSTREVLKAASIIVPSCQEDGVADFIERYVL